MSCSYYTFRQGDYYCTKKSDYVNEDVYYKYCRNWDYSDCPVYKGDTSGGCYLTSACMYSKGLPDDCYELETQKWLKSSQDITFGQIKQNRKNIKKPCTYIEV